MWLIFKESNEKQITAAIKTDTAEKSCDFCILSKPFFHMPSVLKGRNLRGRCNHV